MKKKFENAELDYTFTEINRMLSGAYTEKEARMAKSLWLPKIKKLGFSDVIARQIDLILLEQDYQHAYQECADYLSTIDIRKNTKSYQSRNDLVQDIRQQEKEGAKKILNLQHKQAKLSEEYKEIANSWHKYEKLYKDALICFDPNFFYGGANLMAMRLTYKDKLKLDSRDEVEMCYYLSKTQRKNVDSKSKKLPSLRYLTHKYTNIIAKNQEIIQHSRPTNTITLIK